MNGDLAGFLLARIAEDEAVAQQWPSVLTTRPGGGLWLDGKGHPIYAGRPRVLAECAAKRQIVEAYREAGELVQRLAKAGHREEAQSVRYSRLGLEAALTALAQPYSDHPEFDAAWRP